MAFNGAELHLFTWIIESNW